LNRARSRKRDAYAVYLAAEGAASLFFALVFTVNLVYQATVVRLSPLQLVLVGTLLETTVFLFEVPTGVVADVYSRRLSIIVGEVLIGFGFVVEGAFPRFEAVLLGQVLWGLGATFTSGAIQAWIADEVGEARAGQAFMRSAQVGALGGLAGIPLSVGLASLNLQLPIVLGGVLFVGLGAVLVAIMPETGFKPTPAEERESWRTMARTLHDGVRLVRRRAVLLLFVGISTVYGLYSEGLDRLWTAHFLRDFTLPAASGLKPVVWFGIIGAASALLSTLSTEIVRRRLATAKQPQVMQVLFTMNGLMVTGIVLFGVVEQFGVALIAFLIVAVLRRTTDPVVTTWINPHIESSVRATVFSLSNQVNAIGQIAGGPVVGLVGTYGSIRAAIVASGLILTPVLVLYRYALRQEQPAPLPAAAPMD
jgi:DHA3 family tetracycline resistance protein-like MFS transporter